MPGGPGGPGRPAGITSYVREKTQNGRLVINFLVDVVTGKPIKGRVPRLTDRIDASRLLLKRGFGRVPFENEVELPPLIVVQLKPGQDF